MSEVAEDKIIDDLVASTFGVQSSESDTQADKNDTQMASFDFDQDFQDKIAALFTRDAKFTKHVNGLIKPEYFENAAQGMLCSIYSDYFNLYRTIPMDSPTIMSVLVDAFKKRRVRKEFGKEVLAELKRLRRVSIDNGDYVSDKVSEFARHQALQNFFLESMDRLENHDHDRIFEQFEKIKRIGVTDAVTEIDYHEDIERRTEIRKEKLANTAPPMGISTGIKDLDRHLYHKGWGRKELSVLMGGAKKGKSMGLGHFAVAASKLGYNALYATLEVSGDIIAERMDANVTKTPMYELEDNMMAVKNEVERAAAQKQRGKLKIVEFPTGSLTPNGLRRLIDGYRNQGIIFDLIVVDYADIMRPNHMTSDPIENSKSVWIDLRAIAGEENAAALTATQTNRTGFKADVAKAGDVADDFNKIRIADIVISINRTDEERDKGEARLFIAASRNAQGEITLKIKQDLPSMQFITGVTDVC